MFDVFMDRRLKIAISLCVNASEVPTQQPSFAMPKNAEGGNKTKADQIFPGKGGPKRRGGMNVLCIAKW